ncbi:RagB/SusD family nutrient uptake outer membrane protein [Chitinophaga varians]|uniref:RagB/SusD family nutrient uptake outer membrane protein n=1 Tax=Chitinophaga varians TaxID=2202339 RepID=UPI00165F67CE|nr:RagB/SusD family nutrient uptake outer membrane protein [Chitinophaga varians]MBC9915555.1 RagB/SusD family nutrient uptake outer membrane protein [Chitinophaga varians]
MLRYIQLTITGDLITVVIPPQKRRQQITIYALTFVMFITTACNKFVDVPSPDNKITSKELFKDDASATSAVSGLYSQISANGINMSSGAVTIYTGLTSDELISTSGTNTDLIEFQTNSISSGNFVNQSSIWPTAYQYIYQANAAIEGITNSNGISSGTRNQLLGECKVIRSLLYFYLTQLYGDVPLITSTDYNTTSVQGRTAMKDIYNFIITDLTDAQKTLTGSYPSTGRVRPNIYAASALLARVYLYTGNWKLAEDESSNVINAPQYSLNSDLNKVFLIESNEAIWQLATVGNGINTREGATFVPFSTSAIPGYILSPQLLSDFEPGDPRRTAWVKSSTISNTTYYFPYKYKVPISFASSTVTENYTLLRLAEQYLIRAEARIRQGQIGAGINDINVLRKRARGSNNAILVDLPNNVTQDQALAYVLKERRIELMVEWGNRWLDLKRLHLSNTVLKPIKQNWQDNDTLFPIPNQEIILNKNLTQNKGYN